METTKKLNLKAITAAVLAFVVIIGSVSFLTLTTTGRAIVFAVSDPATVNQAASMKAEYVKHFQLQAGPKQ